MCLIFIYSTNISTNIYIIPMFQVFTMGIKVSKKDMEPRLQ